MFRDFITIIDHYVQKNAPCRLQHENADTASGAIPHIHDAWELKFYPDFLLLIAPGVIHQASIDHLGVICFEKDSIYICWGKLQQFKMQPPSGIPLAALLDFFAGHVLTSSPEFQHNLTGCLRNALRQFIMSLPSEHPQQPETALVLREYFEHNYYRPELSIADAAKFLGCSQQYLARKCREKWYCSPRKLLIDIRLSHAEKLLQNGSCLVADAARLTGWRCPFYFSNTFRKTYGVSPGQFSRTRSIK